MRKAGAGARWGWVCVAGVVSTACGAASPGASAEPRSGRGEGAVDDSNSRAEGAPHFHSRRHRLTVFLPDGRNWRIDDHTRPELRATHAKTRSELVIDTFAIGQLANRQRCEAEAQRRGLVPLVPLDTVDDEAVTAPGKYDSRVWVAVSQRGGAEEGHLFAFGAHLRNCLFVHYATQVVAGQDAELSTRLATARVRIFDPIALDAFDQVPRAAAAPARPPRP